MTLTLALCLAASPPTPLEAAPADPPPARSALDAWNEERLALNRHAMWGLGGWAVANLVGGTLGVALAGDETWRAFHLGNLAWNTVNLALAIVGLVNNWRPDGKPLDPKTALRASQGLETVFFVNAALDVAYLATAAFLWQRGDATADPLLVGFGQALLLQGGALLVFDVVLGVLNARSTGRLLDRVAVTPLGVSGTF